MVDDYLTKQIITYMGNKRKFINILDEILSNIEKKTKKKLNIGEGFSGSGVLSRLFKKRAKNLYVNDIAGYSNTLNKCYLTTLTNREKNILKKHIENANICADDYNYKYEPWISKHWCINNNNNRMYFTKENGIRIDKYRNYIENMDEKYKHFLLAQLLVKCSIHNNTNGQFSAYYKDDYGGKNNVDIKRITKKIELEMPILDDNKCNVFISKENTNDWIKNIPKLDIVYYDPPYNKHPYSIYYFLLDIINNWDKSIEIPNTYRGQPKDWFKSDYNSRNKAKDGLINLLENTKSTYIILSYNNGGIIPISTIDNILNSFGKVDKIPINHNVYNRLKGISDYKRTSEKKEIKEFLWILEKNEIN